MFGGEFCHPLAALDRCTLNKGAFAFKIVRRGGVGGGGGGGGSKMAAYGRVTLNRGGRNSRFDCIRNFTLQFFINYLLCHRVPGDISVHTYVA